jgi:transketolase
MSASTPIRDTTPELDQLCVNTIRALSLDAVQRAESGHPGLPLGAAPMAYVVWTRFLRHNPRNPRWQGRDRFLLSAGHGSMLLYSLLYLTGYDLPLEELKNFRQWESKTPGHPENILTPGVEITTGPLGQGFANGVGMAMGAAHLAAKFNQPHFNLVDNFIYGIVSDGDLMEGVASEAASLAGHLRLGKLIYLYDDNNVTIEGFTSLAFSEDVPRRFESYGWHTLTVEDGNDLDAIEKAIREAQTDERPSLISVKTVIGFGMPTAGTRKAHSDAPGAEAVRETKRSLGWPEDEEFYVPEEALAHFRKAIEAGEEAEREWNAHVADFESRFAELGRVWRRTITGELPEDWESYLPSFDNAKPMATRQASGEVLNALAPFLPTLVGGSADLGPSNNTDINKGGSFAPGGYAGRIIHFGVREHAMGATLTGMSLNGGLIPFGGTFMCFSDYMKPAIRLAALSHVQVVYVFTHDSVGLGEDGPTHQPIEQLAGLRAIPNLYVIRPADVHEVREAWRLAILRSDAPTALILTRQRSRSSTARRTPRPKARGAALTRSPTQPTPKARPRRRNCCFSRPAPRSRSASKRAKRCRPRACRRASSRCPAGSCSRSSRRITARASSRPTFRPASPSKPHRRWAGTGTRASAASASASTASAHLPPAQSRSKTWASTSRTSSSVLARSSVAD